MVWRWVGHSLSLPATDLIRQTLTGLCPSDMTDSGVRRCRTGPNNSGHRNAFRYLRHRRLSDSATHNRQQWSDWESGWLTAHGLYVGGSASSTVFAISNTKFLWEPRCLQGTFHGEQLVVCDVSDSSRLRFLELDRCCGWHCHQAALTSLQVTGIL